MLLGTSCSREDLDFSGPTGGKLCAEPGAQRVSWFLRVESGMIPICDVS